MPEFYLKRPEKLLVEDQSTNPTQLQMKKGKDTQDGWLIPTTNWMAGNKKQDTTLMYEPLKTRKSVFSYMNLKRKKEQLSK